MLLFSIVVGIPSLVVYQFYRVYKRNAKKRRDLDNYMKFCVDRDKMIKERFVNNRMDVSGEYDLSPEQYAYFASLMDIEGEYHANL